jgi:protease I
MSKALNNKKILMIIAADKFRDEEFEIPFKKFTESGAEVTVASTKKGTAKGMLGMTFEVKTTLSEVKEKDYNGVVFVGGAGVPDVRADKRALEIAENCADSELLAAICWAPTILAKSGSLKNRKATVWLGEDPEYGKTTAEVLAQYGASYEGDEVVVDGNIVTGNGPDAALKFAEAVEKKLSE